MPDVSTKVSGVVGRHIDAVNNFDLDAIMETFDDNMYLNDYNREILELDKIRHFFDKEFIGDRITMDVKTVTAHAGDVIVLAQYSGTFDRTMLPDPKGPLITTYYALRNDKIVSLFIMSNAPWPGPPARLLEDPPRGFDPKIDKPAVWPYSDAGPGSEA